MERISITPNASLREWLFEAGRADLCGGFEVMRPMYEAHLAQCRRSHPDYPPHRQEAWAAYSCLDLRNRPETLTATVRSSPLVPILAWAWRVGILAALLWLAAAANAQSPHDPIILRARDEGSILAGSTRQAGIWELDCVGAGVVCTFSANTLTFDVAAGGGDSITVNGTAVADPDLIDSTTISVTENLAPMPDTVTWDVVADAIGPTQIDETAAYALSSATNTFVGSSFTGPNADPADAGVLRLSNGDTICWEASPAGADFCITGDASERIAATTFVGALVGNADTATTATTANAGDSIVSFFPAFTTLQLATELSDEDYEPGDAASTETALNHDNLVGFVGNEHIDHTAVTLTAGAGLSGGGDISVNRTFATASMEADFLASGALTCGASTQGKAQVHTTPLQYCDDAATPALQYAAYGDSTGKASVALDLQAGSSVVSDAEVDDDITLTNITQITGRAIADTTGTLLEARGGTGEATYALGDLLYSDAANSLAKLAGNATTTRKFLRQVGDGAASAAPAWDTLASGDIPNNAADTTGNATTATALAGNGANCAAGAFPLGVDASGAAESCTAQNAGTDITADLEEETHVAEHQENGADELLGENLGTACAENEILKANATGGVDCAADATGAGSGIVLAFKTNGGSVLASSTRYVGITIIGASISVESQAEAVVPFACTAKNMYVNTKTAQPATGSLVLTFRVNGVSSALAVTYASGAAAGIRSDLVSTASVAAGDVITVEIVNNASSTSAQVVGITAQCQ